MMRPDSTQWESAIHVELVSLKQMRVNERCKLPEDNSSLLSKPVLNVKRAGLDNIVKYKARLVAKAFQQIAERAFDEVFAP
jgi:hypothetical protein